MKRISIITDSTSDLSKDLLEKHKIKVIPLHIHLGEKEYDDGVNIKPEDIYKWSNETKETPKTSALSLFEAKEAIEKALEESEEVICFCVSENMSSCYSVMNLAKIELEEDNEDIVGRIHIINSMNLSTGIGLQILEAIDLANEGLTGKEIVEKIVDMQSRVKASFVVDTLTFLHRGGRCSGTTALAGSALKIHPSIHVIEGKMQPGKKYRGKMNKVLLNYLEDLKLDLAKANKKNVFITHSGCEDEIVQAIKEELIALDYFENIYITTAGSVISSHCGPGTLGVLYVLNA